MPNVVKKIKGKFRVVDKDTGKVTKNRKGTAVDGGGFDSKDAADAQMSAINISQARQRGVDIPQPRKRNPLKGAKFE